MSTACLELGKKSDEEMMIKIGEICFFHNRNSSENAYRKCVEMTPDQCDMTVRLGHQAFGRGLKAVSSMWSSNKEPFGGKPYAHFTTNNPQLMCAIVNETLKNL